MSFLTDTMTPIQTAPVCRHSIPAVMMRAGTSKGVFLHRKELPEMQSKWKRHLLAVMGSQGNDTRQIDGVGGATSTTSKVAVISPSLRPGVDVDYTFIQVAVGQETVDLSGNCGNMASGVGPFAVQEGLVKTTPGQQYVDVRIFNTNTSRLIISTLQLDPDGSFKEDGPCMIPGVKLPSSEVKVAFIDPAGSMTGTLLPTGERVQSLPVQQQQYPPYSAIASLVDAANPFVLVDKSSLPPHIRSSSPDSSGYLDQMEAIRRSGAVAMGLAKSIEEAARVRGTPKLAIVEPALSDLQSGHSLRIQAFSMGKPHPSLQLTGAVCIASATCMEGTVAHRVANATSKATSTNYPPTPERTPSPGQEKDSLNVRKVVRIQHGGGAIDVEVELEEKTAEKEVVIRKCFVTRTARQIFKGYIYYYL